MFHQKNWFSQNPWCTVGNRHSFWSGHYTRFTSSLSSLSKSPSLTATSQDPAASRRNLAISEQGKRRCRYVEISQWLSTTLNIWLMHFSFFRFALGFFFFPLRIVQYNSLWRKANKKAVTYVEKTWAKNCPFSPRSKRHKSKVYFM